MQIIINILINFSLYFLVGAGFWMLYKTHKFFDLGHGVFITVGGYAAFLVSHQLLGTGLGGLCWSIVIGVAVTAGLGWALNAILYRYLRQTKQSSLVLMVVSLGLMTIIQSAIALGFTSQYRVIDTAESFSQVWHIAPVLHSLGGVGGGAITSIQLLTIVIALCMAPILYLILSRTRFGKAFRAVADDRDVATIVGIPVEKILLIVAALAAGLAGLGGALIGIDAGILPTLGFALFLKSVVGDIIGGLDNYWGVVIGALCVAILENMVVLSLGAQWRDVAVYSLLLVFLLVRPKGILSLRNRTS